MSNTIKLGNFISEYSVRNRAGDDIPVYSVTNKEGFCRDYFSKDVASQDRSTYKIVPRGCFAYNPSRINVGSVDWQRKEDRVIVSPLYVIFSVSKGLDQQYLYYYLKSEKCLYYIKELASGSVRDNLKLSMLKEFTIPNITLEEQRKAVMVLEQTDRLIALQERQMTVLDELVKSRFVEMFGAYQATIKIGKVSEIVGGITKNGKRNSMPIKKPYLRVANVFFNKIDTTEMLEIGLSEDEYRKTRLIQGDLLFVEGNGSPDQIGRVSVWNDELEDCVHQNHLIRVRLDSKRVLPTFAMYYFMTQEGRKQIQVKAVSTSGLYTLSVSKIADFQIPLPGIDEQVAFNDLVQQIDKSKLAVQQSLEKLETLKKSLMQRYFG